MKLTSAQKKKIVQAIENAEHQTSGEIRVHFSYSKSDENPLFQAQKQFEKLKMHLTKDRNGILIYINPNARKFALYGDEGIHLKLGQDYWDQLKNSLKKNIQEKDLIHGIENAVLDLGVQLKAHFPHAEKDKNELKNDVSESN